MSESGSTTTKPVPAPRRGRKPKEPRALDKLQNVRLFVEEPYWGLAGSSNKQQDRRVLVQ